MTRSVVSPLVGGLLLLDWSEIAETTYSLLPSQSASAEDLVRSSMTTPGVRPGLRRPVEAEDVEVLVPLNRLPHQIPSLNHSLLCGSRPVGALAPE